MSGFWVEDKMKKITHLRRLEKEILWKIKYLSKLKLKLLRKGRTPAELQPIDEEIANGTMKYIRVESLINAVKSK